MVTPKPCSSVIKERLTKLFPTGWIEQRARSHGVLIRNHKVDVTALIWPLVFGFAIGNDRAIEELRTWRENAKPLDGKQVWDEVGDIKRTEIDARVEVTVNRRAYRGQRSIDTGTFRLVGL